MIKYSDLEKYIIENNIDRGRELFGVIGEFIENYKNPYTRHKKSSTSVTYNKDTEFTFERVVELLSS